MTEDPRGRKPSAFKKAPPGQKYCSYGDHFVSLIEFNAKDRYCKDCRRQYNRKYYLKNVKKEEAHLVDIEITFRCLECDTQLTVMWDPETEIVEEVSCYECDKTYTVYSPRLVET